MGTITKLKLVLIAAGSFMLWRWLTLNGRSCLLCMSLPHYSDGCLHDVNHPLFNAREASKQIVLLEQHLFDPRQRCVDCIRKHFLTIEALIEEAVTLDKGHAYHYLHTMPAKIRRLAAAYNAGVSPARIAQGFRIIRKQLVQNTFVDGLTPDQTLQNHPE